MGGHSWALLLVLLIPYHVALRGPPLLPEVRAPGRTVGDLELMGVGLWLACRVFYMWCSVKGNDERIHPLSRWAHGPLPDDTHLLQSPTLVACPILSL